MELVKCPPAVLGAANCCASVAEAGAWQALPACGDCPNLNPRANNSDARAAAPHSIRGLISMADGRARSHEPKLRPTPVAAALHG